MRQLYSVKNMNFKKCINMKIFIGLEGTKLLYLSDFVKCKRTHYSYSYV